MKKEQFTPGPWEISAVSESHRIYDAKGNHIADASLSKRGIPYIQYQDEETANKNLIAAAPDMYEALKKAKGVLSTLLVMCKMDDQDKIIANEILLQIQQSIDKANPQ